MYVHRALPSRQLLQLNIHSQPALRGTVCASRARRVSAAPFQQRTSTSCSSCTAEAAEGGKHATADPFKSECDFESTASLQHLTEWQPRFTVIVAVAALLAVKQHPTDTVAVPATVQADSRGHKGALRPPRVPCATRSKSQPPVSAGVGTAEPSRCSDAAGPESTVNTAQRPSFSLTISTDKGTVSSSTLAIIAAAAAPATAGVVPTTWNAFQKANKGCGYSPAVMSRLWQQHKANNLAATSSNLAPSPVAGSNTLVIAAGAAAAAAEAADQPDCIPTTWNAFRSFNKGKGYSMKQMGAMWRLHKAMHL